MQCAFLMQLSCAVLTLCVKEEDCFSQNGFSYRTEIKRDVKEEFFWDGGSGGRYVARYVSCSIKLCFSLFLLFSTPPHIFFLKHV